MKMRPFLRVLFVCCLLVANLAQSATQVTEVVIEDSNLELDAEETLTDAHLVNSTGLSLKTDSLSSLSGLEHATNLQTLSVGSPG